MQCPICGGVPKEQNPEHADYVVEGIVVCGRICADMFADTIRIVSVQLTNGGSHVRDQHASRKIGR